MGFPVGEYSGAPLKEDGELFLGGWIVMEARVDIVFEFHTLQSEHGNVVSL